MLVGTMLGATFSNVLISMLFFLLIAFLCISLGVVLGSIFTVNQVSGVGSLLITAISLFSGAWMDLKAVGGIFKTIGYAMPFAYGVDASKALLTGKPFSEITSNFNVVLGYTVVFFVLAIFTFKRSMKRI